ncbi:PKD domain-containing protein [Nitrospira moscoviensis]|uniref:DUF7948 domain-containing protein n=1 Tax=Nitrospira moscoviensis TaxID=42253 RepID=A0A0K2GBA8_NITMO|nr:SBBP repeat-containing protein [Nitrospira moscoviensis]ALA58235.1 conserved exported protein of unknown function [Nitrospira moscoviensis]
MRGTGACIGLLAGLLLLFNSSLPGEASVTTGLPPVTPPPSLSKPLVATMLKAPMSFEANQGQTDPRVNFIARGSGYTMFITPTEAVMVLQQWTTADDGKEIGVLTQPPSHKRSVLRMKLDGSDRTATVEGSDKLPGIVNYFIGNDPTKWRTKIPTYAKVSYKEVYPGIDVTYYGNQGRLEYDFIVAPGVDPKQIRIVFEGASDVRVKDDGSLSLFTALGEMKLQKPVVYQLTESGHKQAIAGHYILGEAKNDVRIALAEYDRSKAVVIDPVLDYLTYLGGRYVDFNSSIAVDTQGNAYVTGTTGSLDFPVTASAYDSTFNKYPACPNPPPTDTRCFDPALTLNMNTDYFVAKVNASGTALIYSTYLGGTGPELLIPKVVVDATGHAYVAGETRSADYPVTSGAFQTTAHHSPTCVSPSNCSADGVITKLDPSGSGLVYSTYFGGNSGDGITAIAVDSTGNAYVTGDFRSTDIPITPGAFSSTPLGGYVAKLNAAGSAVVWGTRLGIAGSGFQEGRGITLDAAGNVIVTGGAQSAIMPLVNPVQSSYGGNSDAFLWKFNPTGTALLFSTYLGGSGTDWGYGVTVDSADNIYVTGYTQSTNFLVTSSSYDPTHNGSSDIFVTKLSPGGAPIIYSTFIGGSGSDENRGNIVVDVAGNVYVAADTNSSDFPLTNPLDTTRVSGEIAIVKLNAGGTGLLYSTFLGGSGNDFRPYIALGPSGSLFLTATAGSNNMPVTPGVFQPATAGFEDIFIAKITDKPIANAGPDQSVPEGTLVTLDGSGSMGGSLTYQWTQVAGPPVSLGSPTTAHPTFPAPHVPAAGATVTLQLIVCEGTSSNCSDPDAVNVHITNVNQPPVSQAGPDQTVQEGSPVQLDGSASFDPDIEPLTYTWLQLFGPPVTLANPLTATPSFTAPSVGTSGTQVDFELIVTDPHGLNHSDYVSIFVTNVNQVPTANAGPDQTKNEQTLVTLDGSASHDPDLDPLSYNWVQTGGPLVVVTGANTVNPTFTAPDVGAGGALLTFQLTVHDGHAASAPDTVQVAVVNVNDPPVCSLAHASPSLLWPPNHTMSQISIQGVTDPNNHSLTITYTAVTQDEPVNGVGDGDTSPDAVVAGNSILLRAERAGTGNGRVYVVHFTATDTEGAHCSGTVRVSVPHSKKDPAVEGSQLYNSFGP